MKLSVGIIRIFVGILFILSGLVKANDPLGLSYKMEEFFQLWRSDLGAGGFFLNNFLTGLLNFFEAHALFLSVFMITLEILLGIALLLGWMKNLVLTLLLILMVFFTFLTGYAYLSGKFSNCGCFGDCLPITPYASYVKDLVLLAMIFLLIAGRRYIQPRLVRSVRISILAGSLLLALLLQWYVLSYLPLADCLPFKKGNNIAFQMQPPPGSVSDSTASRFIYEKDGKRYEWAPEELPPDFETYTYIDRIDKLIRKGNAEPAIKGFSLKGVSGADSTMAILREQHCLLVFCLNTDNIEKWIGPLKNVVHAAPQLPVYVVTSASLEKTLSDMERHDAHWPVFITDFTVVKTATRVNPTLYELKRGTVIGKWSGKKFDGLEKYFRKKYNP